MADFEARGGRDRFSTLRRRFAEGAVGTDDIEWLCDLVDAADELADAAGGIAAPGGVDPETLDAAAARYWEVRDA